MEEIKITKENFEEEVLKSDMPVLLDFWAPWCGPCKMLGPVVAEIAAEYDGKLKVGKVNVDDELELGVKYGAFSIPMVAIFKGGEVIKTSVGFMPKEELKEIIDETL